MKTKDMILVSLFSCLMIIGAYLSIPTPWVPLTFQAFFACLAGALLGSKLGALSQFIYLLLGFIGLPVFQGGKSGPTTVLHPTFGYILGFIIAAYIIGILINKNHHSFNTILISIIIGILIIYLIGTIYFYFIVNFYMNNPMGFYKIIKLCVAPFIIKDILLSGIAAIITHRLLPILRKN